MNFSTITDTISNEEVAGGRDARAPGARTSRPLAEASFLAAINISDPWNFCPLCDFWFKRMSLVQWPGRTPV